MSLDLTHSGQPSPESRTQAVVSAGDARTLTLRLRAAPLSARVDAMEGSVAVPVLHAPLPSTLRAGVVGADASPLTLTLRR